MVVFLAEEISHLNELIRSELLKHGEDSEIISAELSEHAAMAVHLFHRIEAAAAKDQPPSGWDEAAARRFIPERRWIRVFDATGAVRPGSLVILQNLKPFERIRV